MTKVLIATDKPFAKVAIDLIRPIFEKANYELVLLENYTQKQELLEAVVDCDAIIIRSDIVDKEVVEAAKNLKIVVRAGAGFNNIDLEACTAANVVAMNTPGQNSNAVAELAIGMMIFMARGLFDGKSGSELKGKSLGIHAYGNVGKLVAKIAKGFDMKVFAFDPFVDVKSIENDGVIALNSIEDLYSSCQYISLHIPLNGKTKQSIGYDLLSKMPKGATLVNTARKEVIHEDELLKLMTERSDFRYVSDIEPDALVEFNQKFPGKVYFTPKKMGAQTSEANINAGVAAAQQIVDFIENGVDSCRVN
jgi:D-3-phosphoglycerate dehydrogenase / 2-oxoglutarate reductase